MTSPASGRNWMSAGWVIVFIVSIVIIINGLLYLLTGAESDTQFFQNVAGVSWATFTATGHGVSTYVSDDLRILGVVLIVVGVDGCAIAYEAFRKGERWAFYILWLGPLGLLYSTVLLYDGNGSTWPVYLILLFINVIGLLLPYRKFFPKHASTVK